MPSISRHGRVAQRLCARAHNRRPPTTMFNERTVAAMISAVSTRRGFCGSARVQLERSLCLHFGQPAERCALYRRDERHLRPHGGTQTRSARRFSTKKYGVQRLVYYEMHETMDGAILRETRMKKWKRAWKVRLIHEMNPEWRELSTKRGAAWRTDRPMRNGGRVSSCLLVRGWPPVVRSRAQSLRDAAMTGRVDGVSCAIQRNHICAEIKSCAARCSS